MRQLLLLVSGIILLHLASCASTQQTGNGDSGTDTADVAEPNQPGWYNGLIPSESDSTSFTGFAHAVSMDRADAESLAEETAMNNLRFEIDKFAESIRRELNEGGSGTSFGSASFIRDVRNAVGSMSLEGASSETEFFEVDSVIHAYTRVNLPRNTVLERLTSRISNNDFSGALRQRMSN